MDLQDLRFNFISLVFITIEMSTLHLEQFESIYHSDSAVEF